MPSLISGPVRERSTVDLVVFVVAAFVLAYATLAQTSAMVAAAAVAAIAMLIVMSLRSVEWAWAVYFASICATGVQADVAGLTVRPEYFAAPLFIVALYVHGRGPASSPLNGAIYIGGAGFVAVALASSFLVAPDIGASLRMCIQLVVAMLAIVPLSLSDLDFKFVIISGTVILSVISVVSIGFFLADPSRRISGLAFEYNVMGALCVGWVGVLFYFAYDKEIVTRQIIVLAVPIVAALILTSTRSAWLALAFVFVFWAVRNVTTRPVTVIASVLAALLSAVYLQQIYYRVGDEDTFLWRLVHVADTETGTGAYRVQIWNDAVDQILARNWTAVFGTGLNSFTQFNPIDPTNVTGAYLSSMWIALVYDVGVVGSAFFLLFVVGLFVAVRHKWRAVPLFVALAMCTAVTNVIWFAFTWTFIALVVGASRVHEAAAPRVLRPRHRTVRI